MLKDNSGLFSSLGSSPTGEKTTSRCKKPCFWFPFQWDLQNAKSNTTETVSLLPLYFILDNPERGLNMLNTGIVLTKCPSLS